MIEAPQDKYKATQVIASSKVEFEHPHPDVHVAKILIANVSWVNTSEGTVVVDTLLTPVVAQTMKAKLNETGGPVKYVIYFIDKDREFLKSKGVR